MWARACKGTKAEAGCASGFTFITGADGGGDHLGGDGLGKGDDIIPPVWVDAGFENTGACMV